MKHFVLTRLNVEIPWMNNPAWDNRAFERRLRMFERFCVPSMAGQANSDYEWIVFVSPLTPDVYKNRISALAARGNGIIAWIRRYDVPEINAWLKQRLHGEQRVLTTRLDSDDALSFEHTALVREIAKQVTQGRTFINWRNGLAWHKNSHFATKCSYSAFFSVVEDSDDITTGYAYDHRTIDTKHGTIQIDRGPGWLQTLHDQNCYSRPATKFLKMVSHEYARKFFPIPEDQPRDSALKIALHNLAWMSGRVGRKLGRGVADPISSSRKLVKLLRNGKKR